MQGASHNTRLLTLTDCQKHTRVKRGTFNGGETGKANRTPAQAKVEYLLALLEAEKNKVVEVSEIFGPIPGARTGGCTRYWGRRTPQSRSLRWPTRLTQYRGAVMRGGQDSGGTGFKAMLVMFVGSRGFGRSRVFLCVMKYGYIALIALRWYMADFHWGSTFNFSTRPAITNCLNTQTNVAIEVASTTIEM
ncbi:hypothetical protein LXA43DRAFT_1063450 [Ganoderma leucocontextum]|nr:hypothetical protein LXA43DRAFT_1063450 [Ganoderma leucocontextum]